MPKLREWIQAISEIEGGEFDLDLYHDEYELDNEATMSGVNMGMFTPEGLKAFEDVLNAEVVKSGARGEKWYAAIVSGVPYKRVEKLQWAQSGYIDEETYDKWFKI